MKIRTDFVTNSSSSSFCVEIEVELKNESRFVFETKESEYGSNSNIECNADEFIKIDEVKDLCTLLNKSMSGTGKNKMKGFVSELKENVDSVEEISSIILRRIWTSYGESASWQIKNDEQFMTLCRNVVNAGKKEKESALEELSHYLETAEVYAEGGWSDSWPTEFMASEAIGRYKLGSGTKTLEIMAKRVIKEENYGDNDLAVETTVIDMENKTIAQTADFYIYGNAKDIGKKKPQKSDSFIKDTLKKRFSDYEILENVPMTDLYPSAKNCDLIDMLFRQDGKVVVAVSIKTKENVKSKTFKAIGPFLNELRIPYVVLDKKSDIKDHLIVSHLNEAIYAKDFAKYVLAGVSTNLLEKETHEFEHTARVVFSDSRSYEYNCPKDVLPGDIVEVDGAKANQKGMVTVITSDKTVKGYYNIIKVYQKS